MPVDNNLKDRLEELERKVNEADKKISTRSNLQGKKALSLFLIGLSFVVEMLYTVSPEITKSFGDGRWAAFTVQAVSFLHLAFLRLKETGFIKGE